MKRNAAIVSVCWLIVGWFGLACCGALAGETCRGPGVKDNGFLEMDLMPPGLDVVAVFDAPGSGMVGGDGESASALRALGAFGLMWQTRRSWDGLAEALGYTPEEAGEALLGGRIVVGWHGLGEHGLIGAINAADTGWVLVAPVSERTARRIRDRLDAVPRRVSGGHAVYSIDSGRTGMAVVRQGETWRMVLAPVGNAALLDGCLGWWKMGAGVASYSDKAGSLARDVEAGWSALVVAYPRGVFDGWFAGSLHGGDDTWTVGFAAGVEARHGAPVALLDEVGGDALLAVAAAGEPWDGMNTVRFGIDLDDGVQSDPRRLRFESGHTLVFREGTGDGGAMSAMISGRGRAEERFGREVDRAIGELISEEGSAPAHRGLFPDAVRTHTLEGPGGGEWPGDRTRVAWCFTADADDRSGVVSMAVGGDSDEAGTLARHGREAWERVADWVDPDAVSVGYARPNRLVAEMGVGLDPITMIVGQIDYASWDIRQEAEMLRGTITVRLAPANAKLGAD